MPPHVRRGGTRGRSNTPRHAAQARAGLSAGRSAAANKRIRRVRWILQEARQVRGPERRASAKNPQAETKPDQARPRKQAWIFLDSFVRFGAFQGVASNPNRNNFLSYPSATPGLHPRRNARWPPAGALAPSQARGGLFVTPALSAPQSEGAKATAAPCSA